MMLVSSCLAGLAVRYNGTDCLDETIAKLLETKQAVTVCPELLGGLAIPREPAEIQGGDGYAVLDGRASVVTSSGEDVTEQFVLGANLALRHAREVGATVVVLKANSPSCGSGMIYDGTFRGRRIAGHGVTAALLQRSGIRVISELELADYLSGIE
ncbi:uncharacterized protein YbbK (DUF523 family) [Paenibacillus phyllosphaerae]|uniref:Uncharacterized protein YbbK (DUF523 family) n=1 Tax=Paenibacillus phyllosphaerae TaxID=274593 RepID=A0A7W5FNZ5_9BACL|nr:DUF523 domain-containing protein [Paenibacillus phyllosphaerae]MBB3111820.1 uncharacterized protein YbbK (DUF523 family) [Paenibacillus phyllosphaerae]